MYECMDCDAGYLTEKQARSHSYYEGHCIAMPDEDD